MLVSGGLGENETGGPTMNLVPKSGGNKFSGQAFFNTAGDWSRGDNIDDALRSQGITRGPGIKSCTTRADRSAARSSATASGFSPPIGATRRPRRLGHRLQQVRGRPGALGLPERRQHRAASRAGPQDLVGAGHRAGDAEEPRHVLAGKPVSLRRIDADDERQGLQRVAQRQLDRARIDHAVARGEHRIFRFPGTG